MSRSFGDFLSKEIGVCCEPDIFRYELKEDDKFIVVASDGVWEYMSNEHVMNTIINCSDADEASQCIVKESVKKWKEYSKKNVDDKKSTILSESKLFLNSNAEDNLIDFLHIVNAPYDPKLNNIKMTNITKK